MRTSTIVLIMVIALAVFVCSKARLHVETVTARISITSTAESILSTVIDFGSADVFVEAGSPDTLVATTITYPKGEYEPDVVLDSNRLKIGLRSVSGVHFNFLHIFEKSAYVALSPSYTYDLVVDLGTGDSYLSLTRLALSDLKVNAGTGDVVIVCDSPQPTVARQVYLDFGTGDVMVYGLGNLRPEQVTADFGVGDVVLDLSGGTASDVSIYVDMGVGDVTFYAPPGVGVRLTADTGVGDIVADSAFERAGSVIVSQTYDSDTLRYDITVDTGVGDIILTTGRPEPPAPPAPLEPPEPPSPPEPPEPPELPGESPTL